MSSFSFPLSSRRSEVFCFVLLFCFAVIYELIKFPSKNFSFRVFVLFFFSLGDIVCLFVFTCVIVKGQETHLVTVTLNYNNLRMDPWNSGPSPVIWTKGQKEVFPLSSS